MMMTNKELVRKYNVAAPRYTSYPTVPYWTKTPTQTEWATLVKNTFAQTNDKEGISLYIHLPYCSSLCTYCGCNTRITVNHNVEKPYIEALLREWSLYRNLLGEGIRVREIHLGGGTPTFFSADNLQWLLSTILNDVEVCENPEFSFEAHPNSTTVEHLQMLYALGFRRLSLGIQDFDERVQDVINRMQSVEAVQMATETARAVGYTSINYDLIYGLPLQTLDSVRLTVEKVRQLRPDRIAFYSYAHVPWIKPSQRKFTEADLPNNEDKRALYELGKSLLEEAGYLEIGLDHFALASDDLFIASQNGNLHRNFMGYTPYHTTLSIGLGASSISDSWTGFAQNVKHVEEYVKATQTGEFPFFKGHVLSDTDMILRQHILNISCQMRTSWESADLQTPHIADALERLRELETDGLVELHPFELVVTEAGRAFVRNICACFDVYLWEEQANRPQFSQTI